MLRISGISIVHKHDTGKTFMVYTQGSKVNTVEIDEKDLVKKEVTVPKEKKLFADAPNPDGTCDYTVKIENEKHYEYSIKNIKNLEKKALDHAKAINPIEKPASDLSGGVINGR